MIVQRGVRRFPDHFRLAVFFGSFFERKSMWVEGCGAHAFVAGLRGRRLRPARCSAPQPFADRVFPSYFWLDPKVPKSQARRKDAGNVWCLTKTGACRGVTAHSCRFDCGGSAKSASCLCPRLRHVVASKPAPFFNVRHRTFLSPRFSQCDLASLRLAKKTGSDERINRNLVQTVSDSLAGRRPA